MPRAPAEHANGNENRIRWPILRQTARAETEEKRQLFRLFFRVLRKRDPLATLITSFARVWSQETHMVRRLVLAATVVLFVTAPASAQLDPETKQPYHWRVVLSARPHPLLTTEFRERVKRDVVAALQTGIGALGTVE